MKKTGTNTIAITGIILILTILILAKILFLSSPSSNNNNAIPTCTNCNIVFISIDTLRAKNVHFLGYQRNTTPNLDVIADQSLVFTNASSVAPWTLPSTMSWFTGAYPSHHKILNKIAITNDGTEQTASLQSLSPSFQTLAQILKAHGYTTGGFTGGAGVDHEFGFNEGFDTYWDKNNFGGFSESIPQALSWIKAHGNERLFVFLHGYDIHGQYMPSGGYDKRFIDVPYDGPLTGSAEEQRQLREQGITEGQINLTSADVQFLTDIYDEKIQRADLQLQIFFDEYKKLGLDEKTIFIITSDHGEELYEHKRIDHGHTLYQELLHVPLLIKIPAVPPQKISNLVRSIDIMPTILEVSGIAITPELHAQMDGISLISMIDGNDTILTSYPETDYRYAVSLRGIHTADGKKYIKNLTTNLEELYILQSDPEEQKKLTLENQNSLITFRDLLKRQSEKYQR